MSEGQQRIGTYVGRPTEDQGLVHVHTYEEHVSHALVCLEQIQDRLWDLARICASLESTYGEDTRGKFASDIGYSSEYVRRLAKTWMEWEGKEKSPILSVKHHSIAMMAPDPEGTLRLAEDHELSTRQLEKHVKVEARRRALDAGQTPKPSPTQSLWVDCERCGGVGRVPKEKPGGVLEEGQQDG